MDTQTVEIIGRNRLVDELLQAGLEVALPLRDRGIDLIAYADIDDTIGRFVAFPIQLKANTGQRFSVDRKYDKFPNLILAFVWNVGSNTDSVTFAMTQQEAVAVATMKGWTESPSWLDKGYYTVPQAGRLLPLLAPYRMTPAAWRAKLSTLASSQVSAPRDDART